MKYFYTSFLLDVMYSNTSNIYIVSYSYCITKIILKKFQKGIDIIVEMSIIVNVRNTWTQFRKQHNKSKGATL